MELRQTFRALLTAALLGGSALPQAAAQGSNDPFRNPFKPPTVAEIVGHQVGQLSATLDERDRMKRERLHHIQTYRERLVACGSCAQRAELEHRLDYWKKAEALHNEVEHAALSTMGLGKYRNIDELRYGMAQELAIASEQVLAKRQRDHDLGQIAMMVGHECNKQHAVVRKEECKSPLAGQALREFNQKVQACRTENDALRMYANDQMIREMCSRLPDAKACMAEHSIVGKAKAYNLAAAKADIEDVHAQRRKDKEASARQGEMRAAERAQQAEDRALSRTMSIQERGQLQAQRREEFREKVMQRQRARIDCENN